LIQPAHLSEILLALLPGALPVGVPATKFNLPQTPSLFFASPPLVALLIRPAPVVVTRETIRVIVTAQIFVAPSVQTSLSILCSSLLFEPLPVELVLTLIQTTLFLCLPSLQLEGPLVVLISPLVVVLTATPISLSLLFRASLLVELPAIGILSSELFLIISFLFASLLFRETSLLFLILAGLFCLAALFIRLALLFPLPALLGALLLLLLTFRLSLLVLRLAVVVSSLLFSLPALLGFFAAPVFVLILLILLRFPLFAAEPAILPVTRFLGGGDTRQGEKCGQGEGQEDN
jgi:hypothetical protein